MSRAFVKEEDGDREPDIRLPDSDSPYFDEAAAMALIEGANAGDTAGAERATGCRWGEPRLVSHIETFLADAERQDQDRIAQLCRRFLKAAKRL
ncbi:MAG: hypothetical protein ACR2QM_16790 [Longimicrobiales bacterium]